MTDVSPPLADAPPLGDTDARHWSLVRIDMPPVGIEVTGWSGPGDPTDEQVSQEEDAREAFLEFTEPRIKGLFGPLRQTGNVVFAKLLCADGWGQMNHYVLILGFDFPIPVDYASLVPPGAQVTPIGLYGPINLGP